MHQFVLTVQTGQVSDKEDGKAELFMNKHSDQWIEFAEKDEEYRSHLIKIFSGMAKSSFMAC